MGNLLELAVEAARVRATLGEISYACEQVVGRYKAIIRTISGVYSSESKNDSDFKRACELAEKSVGRAIASSNALVCKDWVCPKAAAIASIQVRPTLLNGSCSVSDQPEVCE